MNNIWHKYPDILALQTQLNEIDNKLKFDHYLIEEGSVRGIIKNMKRQLSDLIASIGTEQEQIVPIKQGNEKLMNALKAVSGRCTPEAQLIIDKALIQPIVNNKADDCQGNEKLIKEINLYQKVWGIRELDSEGYELLSKCKAALLTKKE